MIVKQKRNFKAYTFYSYRLDLVEAYGKGHRKFILKGPVIFLMLWDKDKYKLINNHKPCFIIIHFGHAQSC